MNGLVALGVFTGGALGGALRYALTTTPRPKIGTLLANSLACAVLAVATHTHLGSLTAVSLGAGLAGALSTWSSLASQIGAELKKKQPARALLLTLAHIVCGMFAWTVATTVIHM